ncbi:hypothetical protein [Sphingomonas canadensis]|uniref:hypothetical protein n=1 Tax=Sphingomonas canadensis TaxID=1219257 RepID=UPI0022302294|nr:hypothetical protein [Sphingomonas canadensis]
MDNEGLRAIPVNLAQLERQGKEFDRRWVEFEAYVFVRGYLGKNRPRPFLATLEGDRVTLASGAPAIVCRKSDVPGPPVLLEKGLGPLRRQDMALDARAQPKVRIRAIYHNSVFEYEDHWIHEKFNGFFDHATILSVLQDRCLIFPDVVEP